MCVRIKKIGILMLVAIALLFPASGQCVNYNFNLSQPENGSYNFVTQNHSGLHFLNLLSDINYKQPGLPVDLWWQYTLIIILVLLILWFYRRYEIKRLKRFNTRQNQGFKSGVFSEYDNFNIPQHSESKEWIDQCLTGLCDKRNCFFYADGSIILLEDHVNSVSEPASVEMLLSKIDAEKFCEHFCWEKNNSKYPAYKFVNKEIINGKKKQSEFQPHKIQIKLFNFQNELFHSADRFASFKHDSVNHLYEKPISPVDEEFIYRAVKFIEANYSDYRFSVAQLAKELNMSVSQINRKLNILTGFPAGRLISKFRLQHASEFLIHRTDTISDICFSVGYNGLAYFSRAFKKEFGCTPSVYRQLMTKKSISVRK